MILIVELYLLGNYPLCFTNTWDDTQILFNPNIPEVAEFKSK
jgi:hypothetical protein